MHFSGQSVFTTGGKGLLNFTMEEPSSWLANTNLFGKLIRGYAFLFAIAENSIKSLMQTEFQVVKDCMGSS